MIGMSSRTANLSRQVKHSNADSAGRYSSSPLHFGHTKTRSNSGDNVMLRASLGKTIAQAVKRTGFTTPAGRHFHPEIQIHRRAYKGLNSDSRGTSQCPDPGAFGANENPFLALALDV